MSVRTRIILAGVCALLAILLMAGYAARIHHEASGMREDALRRYGGETVHACVSARNIARGESFSERNLISVPWLVDLLPEGALVDPAPLYGQIAATEIPANMVMCPAFVDVQAEPLQIPSGYVAVCIPCTNETAGGWALKPQVCVDVYMTTEGAARLVCEGVRVLQTNADQTPQHLTWAVLAVPPDQVQVLISASALHRLYVTIPSAEELARRAPASQDASALPRSGDSEMPIAGDQAMPDVIDEQSFAGGDPKKVSDNQSAADALSLADNLLNQAASVLPVQIV